MTDTIAASSFDKMFRRLKRRQRVVKFLRFSVPIAGALVFVGLTTPLLLESLLPSTQFEGVRLEQDKLVLDQPRATGELSDGGTYEITALTAATKIINQDEVDLTKLNAQLDFVDGDRVTGTSDTGIYSLLSSVLTITSQLDILSNKGDVGIIGNGVADMDAQTFVGENGVAFDFADGSTLRSETMFYDGNKNYWKFNRATLTLRSKP